MQHPFHRWQPNRGRIAPLLLVLLLVLLAVPALGEPAGDEDDEGIELERTVEIEARLISFERVPTRDTAAIARFRIVDGEYRGATFSLAYDFMPPVQLRSWDVHDVSGYRRLGGASFHEPPMGQWDDLLRHGSFEPVETIYLTLVQHDLNEDEKDRRWFFKKIDSILPYAPGDAPDRIGQSTDRLELRPDR